MDDDNQSEPHQTAALEIIRAVLPTGKHQMVKRMARQLRHRRRVRETLHQRKLEETITPALDAGTERNDMTYTSGDRVKTWTGDLGTIMHGGPHNYKVQIDGGGQLWYETSQLEAMTTDPTPAGRYDDVVTALTTLIEQMNQGGYFVADYETCDEDGSMCPTGHITFLPKPPPLSYEGEYEGPIDAGWFSEPEDAPRFISLLELTGELIKLANPLRRERDEARAALETANEELEGRLAAIRAADALIEAMQLERLAYRMTANAQPPGVGGESRLYATSEEDRVFWAGIWED